MATFTTDGADEFLRQLNSLAGKTPGAAKRALYDGAGVMADQLRDATSRLPVDANPFTPGRDPLRVITAEDLADLMGCLGISRIESGSDGSSVSVSFDGYIRRAEPKYPGGVPAPLIARSIEKGSSVRAKNPFVRQAVNRAKDAVLAAMQASLDESIDYTMNT